MLELSLSKDDDTDTDTDTNTTNQTCDQFLISNDCPTALLHFETIATKKPTHINEIAFVSSLFKIK